MFYSTADKVSQNRNRKYQKYQVSTMATHSKSNIIYSYLKLLLQLRGDEITIFAYQFKKIKEMNTHFLVFSYEKSSSVLNGRNVILSARRKLIIDEKG